MFDSTGGIVIGEPKGRIHRTRAIDEQLDRGIERRHPEQGLARDRQRLTAGRDDAEFGGSAKQRIGQLRARSDHVLTVVQDQEQVPPLKVIRQSTCPGSPSLLAHAKRRRNRLWNERFIGKRREFHKPHAVFVVVQ